MSELECRVCSAWRQASEELGVQFSSPFVVTTPDGQSHTFLGLVHHFGRRRGALIRMIDDEWPKLPGEYESEYFPCMLSDSYAEYERELFVDTLNDMGWFGPVDQRPAWYTGEHWTAPRPSRVD